VGSEGNNGEEAACSAVLLMPAARRFPEPCPAGPKLGKPVEPDW
jgi:hypothetical protein